MKRLFPALKIAFILLAALFIGLSLLPGCTDTKVKPGPIDPVVVVNDTAQAWFCTAITAWPEPPGAVAAKSKRWNNGQTIRIGWMGGTATQRKYLSDAVTDVAQYVNLNFSYPVAGPYDIRVSFASGQGSYSYIGTDCKNIPQSQATTQIGWSGMAVCTHELLHALSALHEQGNPNQNICWNKERVYSDLGGSPNFWAKATVDANVFAKFDPATVDATAFDPLSVMLYQIPASWTCDSKGYAGGSVLSAIDKEMLKRIYPKTNPPQPITVTITRAKADSIKAAANALNEMVKRILK